MPRSEAGYFPTISFGSGSTVDDVEYAEITLTNDTSLTLIHVVFWDSTQDPNIDSSLYTDSISDGPAIPGQPVLNLYIICNYGRSKITQGVDRELLVTDYLCLD
jgi:hypothetical protein